MALRPDAIFVSPFNGVSYGQMDHLGVPLIECADYMETSALGRAEWMHFYGMLVGKEEAADKMFAEGGEALKNVSEGHYGARRQRRVVLPRRQEQHGTSHCRRRRTIRVR